jgi:hypothetical protein
MNFSEWTRQQQKQKKSGAQTTAPASTSVIKPKSSATPASTGVESSQVSFSDWTRVNSGTMVKRPVYTPKTTVTSAVDSYAKLKENDDFLKYSSQGAAKKNPSFSDIERTFEVFGTDKREDKIENIVTYSRDNFD